MNILVTGGAGYIGSITCVQLIAAGYQPVIFDSLVNSKAEVVNRIEQVSGQRPIFIEADVRNRQRLVSALREHAIDAVIHFAGLKAVGESVSEPMRYYENNVQGSLVLIDAMREVGVKTLVFSSSATVYAETLDLPLHEGSAIGSTSPYGRTKLIVEQIMTDVVTSDPTWSMTALRYFNPVGAHPSGYLGEDPQGIPNNLMPFLAQVAVGRRPALQIFGNDYPTSDGTGMRDYIHVMDLADGHLAALRYAHGRSGNHVFNLGSGKGLSVLDMLTAFGRACGKPLAHEFSPRRPGDLAAFWADPSLAEKTLGWRTQRSLEDMCSDTWRWQSLNPNGYSES
jgi:UDP-glucose 4-epimerase